MTRFIIIALFVVLWSCEDPVSINIPNSTPKLVVDGVITDVQTLQEIRLLYSNDFNSTTGTDKANGATVRIIDNIGQAIDFLEATDGLYQSTAVVSGNYGNSYQLQIELSDGTTYESDFQVLKPTPAIDFLSVNIVPNLRNDDPEVFNVSVHTTDFIEMGDFYRWKIFKNGFQLGNISDVILRSDRLFNQNQFSVEFDAFEFSSGDSCIIEQYSLSEPAFEFFRLLQIQTGELGRSTSTEPSPVKSNIYNINDHSEVVLGFFYATSVSQAEIVVE
ncbi:MAG: DUF4249 domain-containing protein [Cyclobacteriaceae bacterium]